MVDTSTGGADLWNRLENQADPAVREDQIADIICYQAVELSQSKQ